MEDIPWKLAIEIVLKNVTPPASLTTAMIVIQKEMDKIEKAYGGCHKCYGKGYSTYRHGVSGSPDFEGDSGFEIAPSTHMVFCTCDRGKQLGELLNSKDK
jgi:hypothetical protein